MTHDLIPETALDWHRAGRGAALATVVETWGSAPRQAGSQLATNPERQVDFMAGANLSRVGIAAGRATRHLLDQHLGRRGRQDA